MDEFKAGDRVRMTVDPPHTGYVRDNGTVEELTPPNMVRVKWDSGFVQTVYAGNLQRSESTEDLRRKLRDSWNERLSIQSNSYQEQLRLAAQRAELQTALTKRNATIGRLRAANRELRRDMFRTNKLMLEAQRDAAEAQFELKRERARVPQAPMIPPGTWTPERVQAFNDSPPKSIEVSPGVAAPWPPEPAFSGPLEVGGWYEDDVGSKWRCLSIFLDEKTGEILAYCKKRNRVWFERFGLDGKPRPMVTSAIVDTIIRKVDPPGGES